MVTCVAFDADDTLWHNETLYATAQDAFKHVLADYADADAVMQQLYDTEMQNLEYYGYGIKSHALSMIETAIALSEGEIRGKAVQMILDIAKDMLTAEVQLLAHTEDVLDTLAPVHTLMVITKGDLLDQQSKLMRSGIRHYFEYVEVVSHKTQETYARILAKHAIAPECFLMVGNSLKSDVLPVRALGGHAVHIPYHITWAHEVVDAHEVAHDGYYELEHLGQLPALIERLE